MQLPTPRIKKRICCTEVVDQAKSLDLSPLLSTIVAGREVPAEKLAEIITPKLSQLTPPNTMADIAKASKRIAQAIMNKEVIGIETDHDCDGQTSHAVFFHNFVKHFNHPASLLRSYIGHRLQEGYGLSESVAKRILEDDPRPSLIITADNGSSDEPRIAQLKQAGIDVIVTDHHHIPAEGVPQSAYACLNPVRADCNYGDKYIAGCMVAWLLMTQVRQILIEQQYLAKTAPKLLDSLDFVAVGTIADCVSLAQSVNNRAVIQYGLKQIALGNKPCWQAILPLAQNPMTAEDIAFKIAPLLNSDGRLDSALQSVSFLLAETHAEAMKWVGYLQTQNKQRKEIQHRITQQGVELALEQVAQNKQSLCLFLADGHTGVHGISASRIKDLFGRPTVCLAPKMTDQNLISGSIRGSEGFHVREALQTIADQHPSLFLAFGGHLAAGGVTLKKQDLDIFQQAFEKTAQKQLTKQQIGPVVYTDGELQASQINLDTYAQLKQLAPYGRGFEQPVFEATVKILQIMPIGNGTHARVLVELENKVFKAVWFNARQNEEHPFTVVAEQSAKIAYQLNYNEFQGSIRLDLQIVGVEAVTEPVATASMINPIYA